MKMGDVFCMAGFTAWQPTCSASFKPPKGRVAVVLLLGDADKKNPDSFDPALALNQIGWHREDGELIQGLQSQIEELQKAVELHAGHHVKADEFDRIQAENEALRKQAAADERKLDALLNHCDDGECVTCGQIICPHGDGMHFHHDGCPSCAQEMQS